MAFVSKVGDIVVMDNGSTLVVLDCIEYNDESYLKIATVTDPKILKNDNIEPEYIEGFVKEVVSEDGVYDLVTVTDPILKNALNNIIKEFKDVKITEDAENE